MALTHVIFFLAFFIVEIIYFKLADKFNVIDKPNSRSSHSVTTIRGGGIIFGVAVLFFYFFTGFQYSYFVIGLALIAIISFLDDVHTLNNKLRLSIHLISVLLLIYQLGIFQLEWYWLICIGIFIIATLNAYNFMDGVNGMTGGYSLLALVTLLYINKEIVPFTNNELLTLVTLSVLVFNFFNFRKQAKCFAGDVGSVSIAFILTFFIGQLVLQTGNYAYILLLFVYGLDAALTVFFRKIRKENIFEAHRSHFYQYLANQLKYPHLIVSSIYVLVQLLINGVLIFVIKDNSLFAIAFFGITTIVFVGLRFAVEGNKYLLTPHKSII